MREGQREDMKTHSKTETPLGGVTAVLFRGRLSYLSRPQPTFLWSTQLRVDRVEHTFSFVMKNAWSQYCWVYDSEQGSSSLLGAYA